MNYEEKLNKLTQKFKDIEYALNESSIVAITDKRGVIEFANDKFCEMSKYSREELIGSKQSIINSGYHDREFFKDLWRTIGMGNVWKGEIKNRAKDGTYYWVDTTIVPFLDEKGKPYQYISIRHIITKIKEYERKIERMAFYDPLTMLPNRNSLKNWLTIQREKGMEAITVILIDIDRFKSIKDNYGYHTGDFIIKEVSQRLQICIDDTDLLIKDGGDEFIMFLLEVDSDKNEVMNIVNNIKTQIALPFFLKGEQINISASIGISSSEFEKEEDNDVDMFIDRIIRQADTAMYHAKKFGGTTHCINTEDQNKEMERYYLLEQEIKTALNRGQFFTLYHPLVNLKNNKTTGVEALLRWFNPKLGFVTPAEFVPLLEETGLIIPIGKWVLKSVCKQMKRWHDQGIHMDRVAVNVSPIQFSDPNFVKDVKEILEETGLDATYLEIEITEGTILNIHKPEKTLGEVRDLGVSISIDDFGTGYSSLSYLKRLPINTIKIDKSFIDDLDENGEVLVNTIISLGKNLGFNIVAEGIENKTQLNYLKGQQCPEGQGYFWSKPVEAEKINKIYKKQNVIEE